MSTVIEQGTLPQAQVKHRRRISFIWLIPLVTLFVGAYLAYDTLSRRGPTITITFDSAEGLQPGQAHIKHKDVDLGLVTRVKLSPDASHVIVTAQMRRSATRFLTDKAQFWVVTPRLSAGDISGLETLLSGSYVELLPSTVPGKKTTTFTGLEDPPVLTTNIPGHTFLLHADRIGSLNLGSPVFYRGLDVGTVLGWDLGDMAKSVTIHAFVRAPFDAYVHDGSRFWNASGVSLKLGAEGVKLELESLKALLIGGLAFDTPAEALQTPVSVEHHGFPLYADREAADNASFQRRVPAIAYFDGSLAGLAPGSPVTFRGLHIGEVTSVSLEYDPDTGLVRTPVRFEVEPERFAHVAEVEKRGPLANVRFLVAHGMRAQLVSANLITGQQEISFDFFPNAPPASVSLEDNVMVIPTTAAGGLGDLSRSASDLLAKVNQLPFDQIGQNLNALLVGANALTNGPELKQALQGLVVTMTETQDLVKHLDSGTAPALHRLPEMAASLQAMLSNTNKLVASTEAGYGNNSQFYHDLDRALLQLSDMTESLRVLADLLSRHPEALIRGRTDTGLQ